ncbi:gamma-glutamyltransferase family protein [Asanoa sp. WMMD1127]|uniref:gamma-glutamyltransferase family protein n=1 Tax=Asanoa sp. WMMD1127 TaxID=3016107 RepID=UPI0024165B2D|nr:gamma-glutamyltransferase family protein [Asanoa sp. WMMD1127]MDG4822403.1 gamma-glutamyltransferase family protein [Asanoa sp. WMMD1127]
MEAVWSVNGSVATSQPLAAAAGLAVLRRGGSAVDAAVATAITLTVVQPGSNDIGGDLFAIVWDGTRLHGLNASGRSPAALTLDRALAAGVAATDAHGGAQSAGRVLPARGWLPVTVPGAPAGWRDLHARFGKLPFEELFTDAIGYAESGYPVSPRVATAWARSAAGYAALPPDPALAEWGRLFGRPPAAGEIFANPDQARTLGLIAASGADEFYKGEIAAALAGHAAATGGLLTVDDLANHSSTWVTPFKTDYRGYEVWQVPPNGQGVAASVALAILDGVDLASMSPVERLHWRIEATKLGLGDAHDHVADPAVAAAVEPLLAPARITGLRAAIGPTAARGAGAPLRGGTVYLCAADGDGMMVSLIQSNYLGFGSYVVLPGYGFGLQNRGCGFTLDPDHPNVAGPAKRPYHTIIPGFLTRGRAPVGPFGVMGGHMQPQGHVQLLGATIDDAFDPQAALAAPRWYWHADRTVLLEPGLEWAAADLAARGHEVAVTDDRSPFGTGQAIWRTDSGAYVGGSDPRADGLVAAF